MSSARHRESSANDGLSVAKAGPSVETVTDNDDNECSPSQYRKVRLEEDSNVEESDREADNAVESEGSAASSSGPPSLQSSSADDDDDDKFT